MIVNLQELINIMGDLTFNIPERSYKDLNIDIEVMEPEKDGDAVVPRVVKFEMKLMRDNSTSSSYDHRSFKENQVITAEIFSDCENQDPTVSRKIIKTYISKSNKNKESEENEEIPF